MSEPSVQSVSLADLVDEVSDAIVATDLQLRVTAWNRSAERLYGVPAAEAIGAPLDTLYTFRWLTPDDEQAAWRDLERQGRWRGENLHVLRDGSVRHVESTVTRRRDLGGQPAGLVACIRDVTAQRATVTQLQQIAQEFQAFFDGSGAGNAELDLATGRFLRANRRFCELTGYSEEELANLGSYLDLTHPEDRVRQAAIMAPAIDGDKDSFEFEKRYVRKDGRIVWVRLTGAPIRDAEGRVMRLMGAAIDITDRVEAEERLRASEAFLRRVSDVAPSILYVYDLEERRNSWGNREMFAGLGYSREQLDGLSGNLLGALMHPDDLARYPEHLARILALPDDEAAEFEYRMRAADGSWHWLNSRDMPFARDASGRVTQIVGAAVDVTARKQIEDALRESDREKDQFIAVLAHELRNPLAPIRTSSAVLQASGSRDPVVARCVQVIERQVGQMARLLDDLLDVSRVSRGRLSLQKQPVRLHDVLDAALETARPAIVDRQQRLTVSGVTPALELEADDARLTQIFANLLNNAAKFTDRGGAIDVSVQAVGERLRVAIRDTGIGIAPQVQDRIFGLFAQVHDGPEIRGGGLGIGLYLTKQLVEMHGGTIAVESRGLHQGATFTVDLPLRSAIAAAPAPDGEGAAVAAPARRVRVLVADDNVDAADTLAMLLSTTGCDVRVVYDGDAAVATAAGFQPEVVLLDLGMPGMDGPSVCRHLRTEPWGATALIAAVTGWGQEDDRRRTADAGFDHHLVKPVDPDHILRLVRERGPRPR